MSGQFIGARTVNERRRRRLALEAMHARPFVPASTDRDLPAGTQTSLLPERTRLVTRINSLIRPEPWVAWLFVAAAACLGIAIVWGGLVVDRSRPELAEVLGLTAGHTTRYFTSLMLLCVCQLSFIILWYRTHSRKDFHGRYRVWIWSSLVWPLFFLASLTGGHHALTARVAVAAPAFAAVLGESLWTLPASIMFLTTLRILSKDMASHPQSRWLLRCTGVVAGSCLLTAILGLGSVAKPQELLIVRSLEVVWPLLLSAAFLHHARYVIHVSNEASLVKKRISRWTPILSEGWEELCSMLPSHERLTVHMQPRRLAAAGRRLLGWSCRLMKFAARGSLVTMSWLRGALARQISRKTANRRAGRASTPKGGSRPAETSESSQDMPRSATTEPRRKPSQAPERPLGKSSRRVERRSQSAAEPQAAS